MKDIFGPLPCTVTPSVAGQIPYVTKDQACHKWPHAVGADDIVEVMPAIIKSGAKSLNDFMFRKQSDSLSVLVPHELLRFQERYTESKKSNDIRAGGTTMKAAPLWAPSGKNLTTPELYEKISNAAQTDVIQLLTDYDIDYRVAVSKKRYEKAIKRSEDWIERQLINKSPNWKLVPILCHSDDVVYGYHVENIIKLVEKDETVMGIVLQGLDERLVQDPFALLERRMAILPKSYLKVCYDFFTPLNIIKGFQHGVNIFGGQYAAMMAEKHKAFILPSLQHSTRRMVIIDVQEERYANTTDNISSDSSVDYSLSYIYHLCKVKELLEPIVLVQHNMDQMEKFILLLREIKDSPDRIAAVLELVQ